MKITIQGGTKEIAALVAALQERRVEYISVDPCSASDCADPKSKEVI